MRFFPNLDARITIGPPLASLNNLAAQVSSGSVRIDLTPVDPVEYARDPITFEVKTTRAAWERIEAGLGEGDPVTLEPEDVLHFSSKLLNIAGLPSEGSIQSLSFSPSQDLLEGKLHLRLTFRLGVHVEQFQYVEFEKLKVGHNLLELRSTTDRLPLRLRVTLRCNAPSHFKIETSFAGHDIRKVRQAFRALHTLRSGGVVELYDLDSDRQLGVLRSFKGDLETEWDEPEHLLIEAAHDIATKLDCGIVWPKRLSAEDFSNALRLAAAVRTGTVSFPVTEIALTMPEPEAVTIESAIRASNVVRLPTDQPPPFSTLFGQEMDLGHHNILFGATDFERQKCSANESERHLVTSRIRLSRPLIFLFEKLWPRRLGVQIPGTRPRFVVFDAGAYRRYCCNFLPESTWTIDAIRKAEEVRNVLACANPFVVRELLSHVVDPEQRSYTSSRAALNSLFQHCATEDHEQVRIVEDNESLLTTVLSGRESEENHKSVEALAGLLKEVYAAGDGPLPADVTDRCREIRSRLQERPGRENLWVTASVSERFR